MYELDKKATFPRLASFSDTRPALKASSSAWYWKKYILSNMKMIPIENAQNIVFHKQNLGKEIGYVNLPIIINFVW